MRTLIAWAVSSVLLLLLCVAAASTLVIAGMEGAPGALARIWLVFELSWAMSPYGLLLAVAFAVALALAALVRRLTAGPFWLYAAAAGALAAVGCALAAVVLYDQPVLDGASGLTGLVLQAAAGALAGLAFAAISSRRNNRT